MPLQPILGVGLVRIIGGGLLSGSASVALVVAIITVGLALAIAVVEAVLTELRFRYARLHELLFDGEELIADERHTANHQRAEEDMRNIARDSNALPTSSWFAAFQRAMLEQKQHRVIPRSNETPRANVRVLTQDRLSDGDHPHHDDRNGPQAGWS